MSNQPEALRLADLLCEDGHECCDFQAAAELRRLHEENEALRRERAANLDTINVDNGIITRLSSQRDALLEENEAIHQAITDAENQPSQFGTVTLTMYEAMEARRDALRQIVDEQAEDEGLWFRAHTAAEAYLQQELRRLHAAVEGMK